MSDAVIVALISGGLSLVGIFVSNRAASRQMIAELAKNQEVTDIKIKGALETYQAVTDVKLSELTREVRAHNNFAQRMPVVEEQIRVINHRISDLEK